MLQFHSGIGCRNLVQVGEGSTVGKRDGLLGVIFGP